MENHDRATQEPASREPLTLMADEAERIAGEIQAAGFDRCTPDDVWSVYRHGSVEPSVIGDEYDAALTRCIADALDLLGMPQ